MAYREIVQQIIHYAETQQPTHTIKFTMKIDKNKPVKCELLFKDEECYLCVPNKGYKSKNLYKEIRHPESHGDVPLKYRICVKCCDLCNILRLALFDSLEDLWIDCWFDKGVKFSDLDEEEQEEIGSQDMIDYHTVRIVWDNSWDNELMYSYSKLRRRLGGIIKAYYCGLLALN